MKEIQLEEMWGKINKALTSENKTFLESKTAKILPNNPTSQGFSADQIRRSLYEGILVLFEWLKTTNNSNVDFNNKVMETLTAITENNEEDKQDLANLKQSLIDGTFNVKYLTWAIMATNDENGNRIIDTYATIERLTQVLEALTQEISDRKAADDLEKNERKEETSAIINSVNQEISDRTNAVSVLNNLLTAETENRASEDEKVLQYAQSVNEALGNAKTDLQGKIDSEAQTRLTNDNEIKASITSKEDSLKALINSVKNELNGYITTLNNRVNNLPTNYVFDTYESMTNDLLNASNTKYKVGDTLFIKEVNKPDYWVSAILSTKGTYGYYEISIQESKVDLSNYVKISELSREAIEEKFLETVENGRTKSFAARSFAATSRNSGIDLNNYAEYGYDGVSFHKNGMEYPLGFPEKDGVFALISDIPQALKNPFALTINGQVYDGSSAVSITTETITEHDLVRFWHAGIQIQNDGTNNILRFSAFDTELEEFSPHISCQYDGPQYYWLWKFPKISGTFAMESQIPTKLSQLTNDGNYQTNTSDLKDNTTTFTTASSRSNVASGEKLSVSFGKIAKYFNDLKAVAFSGSKADIDLGNVNNTSDADKPVSNATQQALNNKANSSDVYTKTETDAGLNKSLYNLGYYDTMVENSDGTYTITRQTGYLTLDGVNHKFTSKSSSTNNGMYYPNDEYIMSVISKPSDTLIVGDIICNLFETKPNDYLYRNNVYGISLYTNGNIGIGLTTAIDTLDKANAYLVQNPIYIQYKLATATTERVEKNHYARYNERFILDHNKSEAERSSNLFNNPYNFSGTNNGVSINVVGNECVLNGTSTAGYYKELGLVTLKAGTYTFNQVILSGSINGNDDYVKFGLYKDDSLFPLIGKKGHYTYTLTQDTTLSIVVWFGLDGITFNNCKLAYMLNEGSIALPYQPYNQNKHITNNEADFLKTEHDRSANLFNPNNVEYGSINEDGTNLGSGTARARSFYIPVLANTYYSISTNNSELWVYELYQYDSNKSHIEPYTGSILNNTFTFLTRNNTYYIRILFKNTSNTDFNLDILSRVMLNEGSVALPYQPYEGKVVHEKELDKYVTTDTSQEISGVKKFTKGFNVGIRDDTGIFPYLDDGHRLLFKSYGSSVYFYCDNGSGNYTRRLQLIMPLGGTEVIYSISFPTKNGTIALTSDIPTLKTINGNSIVGSGDLAITSGIFTKLGNKTNFSFDSGSYLVVAMNGSVNVKGENSDYNNSANKNFDGMFTVMITNRDEGLGQGLYVNTEQVFGDEYITNATISGPTFTIYRLN